MKRNHLSALAMMLSVGVLSMSLTGCISTGAETEPYLYHRHWREGAPAPTRSVATPPVKQPEARVDADSDGDGVSDSKDQCPGTPRGIKVDARGCPMDSDNDGVSDDKDQCPNTPAGIKVNDLGCWVLENLNFDTNKSQIKPEALPMLNNVVKILKDNPNMRVELQGHTDNVGSAAKNVTLSKNRANAVMKYLTGHGIAAKRLSAVGFGLSQPIAANSDPMGRAKNRRVELKPQP
ncbi:MAG: OmpA family protein [Magnetococcales bacterium]|nr:OmpA family protein [Magnetococcales bacterium]